MSPIVRNSPIRRFFDGIAEWAFASRLGIADPPLVDYMAELLERFIHIDAIYRLKNLAGRQVVEVAEMLAEAEQHAGSVRREVHRQIGDVTLFWTGVYPESLKRLRGALRKDHLLDYSEQGKRSYHIASTYREGEYAEQSAVLERISRQFELCARGLSEARKEWERHDASGDSPLPIVVE